MEIKFDREKKNALLLARIELSMETKEEEKNVKKGIWLYKEKEIRVLYLMQSLRGATCLLAIDRASRAEIGQRVMSLVDLEDQIGCCMHGRERCDALQHPLQPILIFFLSAAIQLHQFERLHTIDMMLLEMDVF